MKHFFSSRKPVVPIDVRIPPTIAWDGAARRGSRSAGRSRTTTFSRTVAWAMAVEIGWLAGWRRRMSVLVIRYPVHMFERIEGQLRCERMESTTATTTTTVEDRRGVCVPVPDFGPCLRALWPRPPRIRSISGGDKGKGSDDAGDRRRTTSKSHDPSSEIVHDHRTDCIRPPPGLVLCPAPSKWTFTVPCFWRRVNWKLIGSCRFWSSVGARFLQPKSYHCRSDLYCRLISFSKGI